MLGELRTTERRGGRGIRVLVRACPGFLPSATGRTCRLVAPANHGVEEKPPAGAQVAARLTNRIRGDRHVPARSPLYRCERRAGCRAGQPYRGGRGATAR